MTHEERRVVFYAVVVIALNVIGYVLAGLWFVSHP